MLAITPLRIYSTADKDPMKKRVSPRKHRYAINKPDGEVDAVELQELEKDDFLFKKGMTWGKPNFDQLLEFMRHAYDTRVRYMDHEHTKQLVGRKNVLEEFILNVIGRENHETDKNGTTHE